MKKAAYSWNELKSTFWFFPVLIISLSIVLAFIFLYFDSQISYPQGPWQYFLISDANSARSILSTIAGVMIGLAGTVFSIVLVVLILAASQFGSNIVKNFMHVRLNQVVLGAYISTFAYCLIILNTIRNNAQVVFVPSFSILIALLLTVANIILLVFFIHNTAINIQANTVISDISESLSKNIKTLFPEAEEDNLDEEKEHDEDLIKRGFKEKQILSASKSGYLQYVNFESLIGLAVELDILIELHFRPGDYLVKDVVLGTVYSQDTLEKEKMSRLQTQFIVGKNRSQQQDAEHSIHQMVEIAARALSPGINDPYTAITCIDNLTATMCYLATTKFPSKYLQDKNGKLRIIADPLTYEGMLDSAFNQIRQYGKGNPAVIIRLMEALITIYKFTKRKEHKKAIEKHAMMVLNVANKSFDEPNDINDLKERSRQILSKSSDSLR
jgi:uncharacterized membrane protein